MTTNEELRESFTSLSDSEKAIALNMLEEFSEDLGLDYLLSQADVDLKPSEAMANEARRGLKWREEYNRGGTGVGVARARDIANRKNLSPSTVGRMVSFFSRHEKATKGGQGYKAGTDGYPSAGRIAWALWGGDAGFSWAKSKHNAIKNAAAAAAASYKVGDNVSWNSSGGTASGRIVRIVRSGTLSVPDSSFTLKGSSDNPAALIRVYRDGKATDRYVGHRFSTLRKS